MKYVVTINDKDYEVEVERGEARVLSVTPTAAPVAAAPAAPAAQAAPAASVAPAAPVNAVPAAPMVPAAMQSVAGDVLRAPMPGMIMNVVKKVGDPVQVGDIVLIMEAMKMENEIVATHSGMIMQVHVAKGANVTTGDPLVTIG